jgi:hypothetical protein
MADADKIKSYRNRYKALSDERIDDLLIWKEISNFISPSKGLYISEGERPNKRTNRYRNILDDTATRALTLLGAGMQGGLTSPSRPWFKIVTQDDDLMKFESVAQWTNYVEKQMYGVFKRSNFYSSIHQAYEEQAGFGTTVFLAEEDFDSLIRFYVLPPGIYCIALSDNGMVKTLFRRYWMSAMQMATKFGKENLSDQVQNCLSPDRNPYEWFQVMHVIEPRDQRDVLKIDTLNMPYSSFYFEFSKSDQQKPLRESGFHEQPFAAPRWSVNGSETYGKGPAHLALGPTKILQSMSKASLKAVHKEVDPPMRVPTSYKDTLNMLPGGVNPVTANDPKDAIGKLFDMRFDYAGTEAKIERIQSNVERTFYNDLFFTIINRPEMTATEVLQRHEEQLIMLGPTIERQITELLDPMLERTFNVMDRAGMIPPVPPEMEQQPLKVDYISLLAQAQKMMGLQHMDMFLNIATATTSIDPQHPTSDKIDTDAYLDEYALRLGISPEITRSPQVVAQIRQMKQQQMEQERQQQMLMDAADGAKTLSGAKTDEKNALTDVVDAIGGGDGG